MRLEERLDMAARRVGAALVAVEKIRLAVDGAGQRHFEQGVTAELIAGGQHRHERRIFIVGE